jgi:hypothetical protein
MGAELGAQHLDEDVLNRRSADRVHDAPGQLARVLAERRSRRLSEEKESYGKSHRKGTEAADRSELRRAGGAGGADAGDCGLTAPQNVSEWLQ